MRELLQQALDALESLQGGCTDSNDGTVEAITVWCPEVITALREALAAPQPAPFEMVMVPRGILKRSMDLLGCVGCSPEGAESDARDAARLQEDIKPYAAAPPAAPAPAVRVLPGYVYSDEEMDAIASKYAHKLALDLECVLLDYHGKWWDTAMQTLGEYRMAMNAIHERESPTHMGEPVLPRKNCDRPDCPAGGYGPCAPCEREHSGG